MEATPDTVYRMQANPGYFLGAPPVGELVFPVVKDATTALQALRAGEVQGSVAEVPPEQVAAFSRAPLAVMRGPSYASTLLQLNAERPPLDRPDVRRALDLAIDKQRLVETLLLGTGTPAAPGFVHPDSPFHDRALGPRFDPARAKALLDGAGARPGADGVRVLDGEPLAFTLLVQANNPLRLRAAELLGGMLKEVGVAVAVKSLDADSVDARVWPEFDVARGRDYDLAMWGWSAPVQVDIGRIAELVHSDPRIGTLNIGGYRSAEADRLADALRAAVGDAPRAEAARAVERQIAADVPFVMLYFADGAYAYRPQAYDGWVYQKGQGIYTRLSFVPGFGR